MKISDLKKEAKNIINSIFKGVISSDDKENWKKAILFIDNKIFNLEKGDRGVEMFIWREVKKQITSLFGEKFVKI